jgi:hypothetical protein
MGGEEGARLRLPDGRGRPSPHNLGSPHDQPGLRPFGKPFII